MRTTGGKRYDTQRNKTAIKDDTPVLYEQGALFCCLRYPPAQGDRACRQYAAIVSSAPLDLYYIYYELYVKGLTQEATAEDLNYSTEYIRQKNKKLLLFLQSKLNEREVS